MDFLKNQLERIRQQLGGLSPSQKMLAASLIAITVIMLMWWSRYAGQAEMEPVLDQSLAADDIKRITDLLRGKSIAYKVAGDRVLVSAERSSEVRAELAFAQMLPSDTKNAYDEIINKSSPFDTTTEKNAKWNKAKELTLAQDMRHFPGVSNALVLIDTTERRDFNGGVQPSAMINLSLRSGAGTDRRKLVEAAADMVCGAVANLNRGRVRVIVDGVSFPVHEREDTASAGTEWLEQLNAAERHFARKVGEQLAFIPGAMISVTVIPNNKSVATTKEQVNTTKGAVISEETTTEEIESGSARASEPGAVPNTGMALTTDGGAGESSTQRKETSSVRNAPSFDRVVTSETDHGGNVKVTGASVFVPRSYFVEIYKRRNPAAKEPDDGLLQPLVDAELPKYKASVVQTLGLESDAAVHVDTYTDLVQVAAETPQVASATVSMLVGGHAKEIAVGALALISLCMVGMMVRKAGPAPAMTASAPPPKPPMSLNRGEEPVGEAGEGGAMLDGMELDEDSVKAQQMLEQVSAMVKDNPDAAANLVKRWLNRA